MLVGLVSGAGLTWLLRGVGLAWGGPALAILVTTAGFARLGMGWPRLVSAFASARGVSFGADGREVPWGRIRVVQYSRSVARLPATLDLAIRHGNDGEQRVRVLPADWAVAALEAGGDELLVSLARAVGGNVAPAVDDGWILAAPLRACARQGAAAGVVALLASGSWMLAPTVGYRSAVPLVLVCVAIAVAAVGLGALWYAGACIVEAPVEARPGAGQSSLEPAFLLTWLLGPALPRRTCLRWRYLDVVDPHGGATYRATPRRGATLRGGERELVPSFDPMPASTAEGG